MKVDVKVSLCVSAWSDCMFVCCFLSGTMYKLVNQ